LTFLDWLIVLAANGAIVGYGVRLARGTRRAYDWFLAARELPWWVVGLSMFATAVDSGDYVAVVGGAYDFGLQNLTSWWLGLPIGWFFVSFFVFVPLYRTGMFTNAEYLEYRFGPAVRALSALIQLQYRTNVLGNITFSLYLLFSILTGWGRETWFLIVGIAAAAALYTAMGGLKSVAVTDALQSVVMFTASAILWTSLWTAAGGWSGLEQRLAAFDPALVDSMMHVGGRSEPGAPPAIIIFGWVALLTTYCVVNHSQAMRLLASRSEWDMRMAAVAAAAITALVMFFNITLGVLGRAVFPALERPDEVYPRLLESHLEAGLVGLVVAGVLAGGISTYDSIGSSLAAIFTRDIYARFFVRGRGDEHYLKVSRWATPAVIAVSFLYLPFLESGMVAFQLRLTSVAVVPLMTVYAMGTLTRVPRPAGGAGLAAGVAYGFSSIVGDALAWPLPLWWTNTWWAYLWSILITAGAMLLTAAWRGWQPREELQGLICGTEVPAGWVASARDEQTGWLDKTHAEVPEAPKFPPGLAASRLRAYQRPEWLAVLLLGGLTALLVLLW